MRLITKICQPLGNFYIRGYPSHCPLVFDHFPLLIWVLRAENDRKQGECCERYPLVVRFLRSFLSMQNQQQENKQNFRIKSNFNFQHTKLFYFIYGWNCSLLEYCNYDGLVEARVESFFFCNNNPFWNEEFWSMRYSRHVPDHLYAFHAYSGYDYFDHSGTCSGSGGSDLALKIGKSSDSYKTTLKEPT